MKTNSIVVVNLQSPKERFFGRLIEISTSGVTVRGIDLNSFYDWINHVNSHEESGVQPTTIFFPLHRVEKIILDEGIGACLLYTSDAADERSSVDLGGRRIIKKK